MYLVCQRCGSVLPAQTLPGAVFHQKLCLKFGAPSEFKVIILFGQSILILTFREDITRSKNSTRGFMTIIASDESAAIRERDSDSEEEVGEDKNECASFTSPC
jgi:hypothetical protein